ncbi:hypothetical protein PPERSA_07478 [Pseudocohnilembus persalinus]|uniref:Uncharacterized protein n=1 Tax=Pseudocohnilembus persalinus TaxID=266149 RepID=A0A0V0R2W1_PSEPJ|nr:hypothetical protein PPERSA_07478 [Pseudocohnilembus persalinus]|eukprot:KRX08666.1 hypothetical protein PPERSA_07478 [Pseudocohnilembus persalinus]
MEQKTYQSNDKIDIQFQCDIQSQPTIRGIPRIYDLMQDISLQEIQKHDNLQDTKKLNSYYDQYYPVENPYSNFRKNYQQTKYGYVEADPLDEYLKNQQFQRKNQIHQKLEFQQGYQQSYNDIQDRLKNQLLDNSQNFKNLQQLYQEYNQQNSNSYTQQQVQSLQRPLKYLNEVNENQKQQKLEPIIEQIHITLDNPQNPYYKSYDKSQSQSIKKQISEENKIEEKKQIYIPLNHPQNPYFQKEKQNIF